MFDTASQFQIVFTPKVKKQLKILPAPIQKQYRKAFAIMALAGPSYRSLRTHRYQQKKGEIWGSSASMALRFYWDYVGEATILVMGLDSH